MPHGDRIRACAGRDAQRAQRAQFGARHALEVLRLVWHMILRLLAGLVPFVLAAGLVYMALLRETTSTTTCHSAPESVIAAGLVAFIGIGLALSSPARSSAGRWRCRSFCSKTCTRDTRSAKAQSGSWARAPHSLDPCSVDSRGERALHRRDLKRGSRGSSGRAATRELAGVAAAVHRRPRTRGRRAHARCQRREFLFVRAAPHAAVLRLTGTQVSASAVAHFASSGPRRFSGRERAAILVVALLAALGVGLLAFLVNRGQNPALVIAHRGASATAPRIRSPHFGLQRSSTRTSSSSTFRSRRTVRCSSCMTAT